MKKSKVIFLIVAAIFFVMVLVIAYDISSKTTHPGAKSKNQEQLINTAVGTDSLKQDSLILNK